MSFENVIRQMRLIEESHRANARVFGLSDEAMHCLELAEEYAASVVLLSAFVGKKETRQTGDQKTAIPAFRENKP